LKALLLLLNGLLFLLLLKFIQGFGELTGIITIGMFGAATDQTGFAVFEFSTQMFNIFSM
jgi:hypothetical protein